MAEIDTRPTGEIVAEALRLVAAREDDDQSFQYWNPVCTLQKRGGQPEFDAAKALIAGDEICERVMGADILGQLGHGSPTFVDESALLLVGALTDPDEDVVVSAAYALGHRRSPLAIERLVSMTEHASILVRRGIAYGLGGQDDRRATDGLIRMCSDSDAAVRDWASFGLAELCDADYAELRAALRSFISDPEPEIRGQAFVGLARRKDTCCINALRAELRGEFNGIWAVEAAGYYADPSLIDDLVACRLQIDGGEPNYFLSQLEASLDACRKGIPLD